MGKPLAEYKKKAINQDQLPISLAETKQLILNAAGFSPVQVADFMHKATNKLIEKLDAKKTEIITFKGEVTATIELEDHAAQIRAAEALEQLGLDVAGLRQRAATEANKPPNIHLDFSGWSVSPPLPEKDVTPDA